MNEQSNPKRSEHEIEQIVDRALGQSDSNVPHDPQDSLLIEMEIAAAMLDQSIASAHPVDVPDGLADRLKAQVAQFPEQLNTGASDQHSVEETDQLIFPQSLPQSSASQGVPFQWMPWMVAAASLLIATVSILMPRGTQSAPDLDQQRLALMESTPADELIRWDWISTDDSAVVGDVIGDVVWSDTLNKGYMRISGLAVNDPSMEQYQLWIFDATRPTGELPQFGEGLLTQRPIDGGVFDVNADGEVIIEINAKLFVQNAAAFAITVESPGGVVVSDRSRVPLLALAP